MKSRKLNPSKKRARRLLRKQRMHEDYKKKKNIQKNEPPRGSKKSKITFPESKKMVVNETQHKVFKEAGVDMTNIIKTEKLPEEESKSKITIIEPLWKKLWKKIKKLLPFCRSKDIMADET